MIRLLRPRIKNDQAACWYHCLLDNSSCLVCISDLFFQYVCVFLGELAKKIWLVWYDNSHFVEKWRQMSCSVFYTLLCFRALAMFGCKWLFILCLVFSHRNLVWCQFKEYCPIIWCQFNKATVIASLASSAVGINELLNEVIWTLITGSLFSGIGSSRFQVFGTWNATHL